MLILIGVFVVAKYIFVFPKAVSGCYCYCCSFVGSICVIAIVIVVFILSRNCVCDCYLDFCAFV